MVLSGNDYKNILETIDIIYSVPNTGAMFHALSDKLRKFIGVYSAIFVPVDARTGAMLFGGYEIYNNSEGAMLSYLAHYAPQDPFVSCGWFRDHPNEVARNTDLHPKLIGTEFARDFLMPLASVFYILASTLRVQGDVVGILGIHRQKCDGNFSGRHKAIVNCLLPHVAMSIRNRELMSGGALLGDTHGVIMTDEEGRPCFINTIAQRVLRGRASRSVPDPGLGSKAAFFRSGPCIYRVRTVPIGGKKRGRFIILEQHPPEHKMSARLDGFTLSDREKEVAALVVRGHSNREIAERLFISEMTVKDHLKSIFGKLEIRRRGELAAKVLGFTPRN